VEFAALIGTLLGGRYRIKRLLGAGGMGAVFLAEHEVLQRPFAVKVLRPELAEDPRLIERFHREARAASRIQHPSIVYISDFGQMEDGGLYLVMEYIPGKSLREELFARGALPLERGLRILVQIADALDCAHRAGVVHRDLKPDNLLLTEHRGRPDFVKVLDFGVAKMVGPESAQSSALTARGELFGTPEYMAPEQIQGRPVSSASDIYSLGVVAYEVATGETPFSGSLMELVVAHSIKPPVPPSARRPEAKLSPAFDAIVARCLAKKPEDRYATAQEIKEAFQGLRRVLGGQSATRTHFEDTEGSSPLRLWADLGGGLGGEETTSNDRRAFVTEARPDALALQRTVRDLAEGLRYLGLGSPEVTVVLTRLIGAEERVFAEQAEVALIGAHVAETDQLIDERAARLRYAAMQLNQERARAADHGAATAPTMTGHPGAALAPDLEAQLSELEARMAELEAERSQRVAALDSRRRAHHEASVAAADQVEREMARLLELVEAARPQVEAPELLRLYDQIDALKPRLRRG